MRLVIPVNGNHENALIVPMKEALAYVELLVEETKVEAMQFFENTEAFIDTCDYVIVDEGEEESAFETFLEYGIPTLKAPPASTIDSVFEAFLFRELREIV